MIRPSKFHGSRLPTPFFVSLSLSLLNLHLRCLEQGNIFSRQQIQSRSLNGRSSEILCRQSWKTSDANTSGEVLISMHFSTRLHPMIHAWMRKKLDITLENPWINHHLHRLTPDPLTFWGMNHHQWFSPFHTAKWIIGVALCPLRITTRGWFSSFSLPENTRLLTGHPSQTLKHIILWWHGKVLQTFENIAWWAQENETDRMCSLP